MPLLRVVVAKTKKDKEEEKGQVQEDTKQRIRTYATCVFDIKEKHCWSVEISLFARIVNYHRNVIDVI